MTTASTHRLRLRDDDGVGVRGVGSFPPPPARLLDIILGADVHDVGPTTATTGTGTGGTSSAASAEALPPSLRDSSLTNAVRAIGTVDLLRQIRELDGFRRRCANLYERVRASFFLYAIYRFHLPDRREEEVAARRGDRLTAGDESDACEKRGEASNVEGGGEGVGSPEGSGACVVCPEGYAALLDRRFGEAIDLFLASPSAREFPLAVPETVDSGGSNKVGAEKKTALTTTTAASLTKTAPSTSTASSSTGKTTAGGGRLWMPSDATMSALARSYRSLAFQTLQDQVQSSVKSHPGNEWMFEVFTPSEYPRTLAAELLPRASSRRGKVDGKIVFPTLVERTPVRMDLSHSCWSDIFFLGMDYPEGARVINCSVDLAVRDRSRDRDGGEQNHAVPPIECRLRLTDECPGTLVLTSVDLKASVALTRVSQVFDYAADYLGLLRAGVVASGLVPPGLEGCDESMELAELWDVLIPSIPNAGRKYGLELVTKVNDIPKGSRLAVSTNLLGSIIALGMRATGQTSPPLSPTALAVGELRESDRRLVAARAILGEWLGGSGGGWQDSGGIWPGLKLIHGVRSAPGDPEWGVSRGRLLPNHRRLDVATPDGDDGDGGDAHALAHPDLFRKLGECLVLVHGGMAQNVGPILEMVTEKYLLREAEEWVARGRAGEILDELLDAFRTCDVRAIADLVTENFFGPICTVVPWATNSYTEALIDRARERFGAAFWGFWMLGGMSGGGMGFIFDPDVKNEAMDALGDIMIRTKREMEHSLPFAMDPVVFDYKVNERGTVAELCLPEGGGSPAVNCDADQDVGTAEEGSPEGEPIVANGGGGEEPAPSTPGRNDLDELLREQGFDADEQERIRADLRSGAIGLAKNRLPLDCHLSDVMDDDVIHADDAAISDETRSRGLAELLSGSVGVVTLAAGVGSRWTQGAGVVKAIHPLCSLGGRHRTFLDVHLAKSQRVSTKFGNGATIPHVFTTSWMTNGPIVSYLDSSDRPYKGSVYVSKGKSIGLRMIPTVRDLNFLWKEQSHQRLDEQAQKVRDSLHAALIGWAESSGEGSDYRDNVPKQCLCPVGHWYEVPNLLLNGTLAKMLRERPQLKTLMVHNIDTVGADVDPGILGLFLESGSMLAYEVVPRRIEDMGGGLCRVDGRPRLIEGLALPREEDELKCSYYNSLTTWVDIDRLLLKFGLTQRDIVDDDETCRAKVAEAVHRFSRRLPTYITIKDVKKRWGNGQEDVHPVAQFEKLWGDMSTLDDAECSFFVVSRRRGQQLKDPAQLDGWSRDGSAAYLESICLWND